MALILILILILTRRVEFVGDTHEELSKARMWKGALANEKVILVVEVEYDSDSDSEKVELSKESRKGPSAADGTVTSMYTNFDELNAC